MLTPIIAIACMFLSVFALLCIANTSVNYIGTIQPVLPNWNRPNGDGRLATPGRRRNVERARSKAALARINNGRMTACKSHLSVTNPVLHQAAVVCALAFGLVFFHVLMVSS